MEEWPRKSLRYLGRDRCGSRRNESSRESVCGRQLRRNLFHASIVGDSTTLGQVERFMRRRPMRRLLRRRFTSCSKKSLIQDLSGDFTEDHVLLREVTIFDEGFLLVLLIAPVFVPRRLRRVWLEIRTNLQNQGST